MRSSRAVLRGVLAGVVISAGAWSASWTPAAADMDMPEMPGMPGMQDMQDMEDMGASTPYAIMNGVNYSVQQLM